MEPESRVASRKSEFWPRVFIVLAVLVLGFIAWFGTRCNAGSWKARKARSLPEERLEALYDAMKDLRSTIPADKSFSRSKYDLTGDQIPAEFQDLGCRVVRAGTDYPLIRLEGCFDHHLDLHFYGIGEPSDRGDHSPRITMASGDSDRKEELLWRPKDEVNKSR